MPNIFEIYDWLFEGILWIPVIAILLLVLVGVGYAIFYVLYWPVCVGLAVWALGSPIFVPLFIYYAGISESLWFPWLAAISAILGLITYPALIKFFFKKEDKAKKDESSAEVGN